MRDDNESMERSVGYFVLTYGESAKPSFELGHLADGIGIYLSQDLAVPGSVVIRLFYAPFWAFVVFEVPEAKPRLIRSIEQSIIKYFNYSDLSAEVIKDPGFGGGILEGVLKATGVPTDSLPVCFRVSKALPSFVSDSVR